MERSLFSVLFALLFIGGCSDPTSPDSVSGITEVDGANPSDTTGETDQYPDGIARNTNPSDSDTATGELDDTHQEDTSSTESSDSNTADSDEGDTGEAEEDTGEPEEDTSESGGESDGTEVDEDSGSESINDASEPGNDEDTDLEDAQEEEQDGEEDSSSEPDTVEEAPPLSPCPGIMNLISPLAKDFIHVDTPTTFQVQVTLVDGTDPTSLQVNWEAADGSLYGESPLVENGGIYTSTLLLSFPSASALNIYPRLSDGISGCEESKSIGIHVCKHFEDESFPGGITDGWNVLNAAYWVNGGEDGTWVELTGNISGQKGFLYNQQVKVTEGSASIQMTFSTGGGINSGADGLAMTVVDVETIEEVLDIIDDAATGGGLGYGVGGAYGPWEGDALHIEVDTWNNIANGAELHTDPTPSNHIAIALDGDPGNAVAWTAIPSIEDLQWHTIRVDIDGSNIRVFFDGQEATKENVDGLDFRGGFIYFSASTGWATNFHRVSDLKVLHGCQ